jgi:hypothetical protein
MTYSSEILAAIKRARHEKVINKTREHEREQVGGQFGGGTRDYLHVLARMTQEGNHMDKVVRSVSEVGYVGQLKRRLELRLKDRDGWTLEIRKIEDKKTLDAMMGIVERESLSERRR